MSDPISKPSNDRLSPFTLLATTALAVSNLIVGILQNNSFLILASAIISGAFAIVYAHKSGMLRLTHPAAAPSDEPTRSDEAVPTDVSTARFPLWLFLALIFILMPATLLFLQTLEN